MWAMSVVIAEHEKKFDPGEEFGHLRRFRHLAQGSAALVLAWVAEGICGCERPFLMRRFVHST